MALNTTRVRRRLPEPPTDGTPAMDAPEPAALAHYPAPAGPSRPARPAGPPRRPRTMPTSDDVVPTDGRSLRATGRTTQLNLKVAPETKARFLALAQARNALLVDLFEDAISALEAENAIHTEDEEE